MKYIKLTCRQISENPNFIRIIFVLILINAILIGIETYPALADKYSTWIYLMDTVLLWVFTLEIIIRVLGSKSFGSFFKDPWNVFDFIIVFAGHALVGAHFVIVLRILRVLRVLRAISIIPSLRKVVTALLLTIPSMGTILLLLSIFFYIYGVIGTFIFREVAPEYFASLHTSILTLVQIVTLDSWSSGVMRPILEKEPTSWWYFVSFVLIGSFVIINLVVGVIVSNVDKANKEDSGPDPTEAKLAQMQKELAEIKELLVENKRK